MNTIETNGPGAAGNAEYGVITIRMGGALKALRDRALQQNPALALCSGESFTGALMQTLQLGLDLDRHVALVPQRNGETGVLECVFRLCYKGYLELNRRCGKESA
jgi:recombinational DNA repair protein RecT